MNVWKGGNPRNNPYYTNAFAVCRVGRETVRHGLLVKMISQTKRMVTTVADSHTIAGRPVTAADINAAEKRLLDIRRRAAEELLHHDSEKPDPASLRKVLARVEEALAGEGAEPPPLEDLSWLDDWLRDLCERFLARQPQIETTAGPEALEIVPPCGPVGGQGGQHS